MSFRCCLCCTQAATFHTSCGLNLSSHPVHLHSHSSNCHGSNNLSASTTACSIRRRSSCSRRCLAAVPSLAVPAMRMSMPMVCMVGPLLASMTGLHYREAAAWPLIQRLASLLLLALRSAANSATSSGRPAAGVPSVLCVVCGWDTTRLVGTFITTIQAGAIISIARGTCALTIAATCAVAAAAVLACAAAAIGGHPTSLALPNNGHCAFRCSCGIRGERSRARRSCCRRRRCCRGVYNSRGGSAASSGSCSTGLRASSTTMLVEAWNAMVVCMVASCPACCCVLVSCFATLQGASQALQSTRQPTQPSVSTSSFVATSSKQSSSSVERCCCSLRMIPTTGCSILLIALVAATTIAIPFIPGNTRAVCFLATAAFTSSVEPAAAGTAPDRARRGVGAVLAATVLGPPCRCRNTTVTVSIG